MVSSLWKACAEGDLGKVTDLLNEGSSVDIEIKDHTGVTPLICAIQTGKVDLVKVLLDRGADPTNASSQGPPEQYTADPSILELLASSKSSAASHGMSTDSGYSNDLNVEHSKTYYPPQPGAYYYPGMPPPMLPEGAVAYYPPPPPPHAIDGNGLGNLPPPDIARMIPCRYYPACRYGSSCLFAHPQSPYLQGPLPPPAQYPTPYDPMTPAPYPTYYSMNAPSFPPPPNGIPVNPVSPPPTTNHAPPVRGPHPIAHVRSGSEFVSPIQGPFSPSGVPPPVPYGVVSPVSPSYAHPGPIPDPLSIPPLPPLQHLAGPQPQSPPQVIYPPTSPIAHVPAAPHYLVRRESIGQQQYPSQGIVPGPPVENLTSPRSPTHHINGDGYPPVSANRDTMTHHRRGSTRRPSFGGLSRKPPCLFFPSGRCRNGDDCRFPHVLPDGPMGHNPPYFAGRGGHRPRPTSQVNGFAAVEEKFTALSVQEQQVPNTSANGTDGSSRSQSTEPGSRSRSHQGFRPNHYPNGSRVEKKLVAPRPQRVPSADEFPVLGGSSTPPLRSPGPNGTFMNGHIGPTAAQVLQAPPPRKEKDSRPSTRGGSPDSPRNSFKESTEVNGPVSPIVAVEVVVNKLPLSFAAVTTAMAPDFSKEVSVSA